MYIKAMRRTFIILALAAFYAHAVDCIRHTFNYFATNFEEHALVMAGDMLPDSLYQEQNGLIYTIKYHWTGTHLDSMGLYQSCHARNIEKRSTYIPDWEINSTKVGNVKKYDWKFQKEKGWHFTVYHAKDSVYIDIDKEQHQTFYIKNDTIHEVNNLIPMHRIIYRDQNNESKCIRTSDKKNFLIGTYEYEMKGNTIIQKSIKFDNNRYFRAPDPCTGGNEYTTIYYKKK